MTIEDINYFGKMLDLLSNRCKIINQMLGFGVVGLVDNPMALRYERGRYVVSLGDDLIASFGVYDLTGIAKAVDIVDGVNDGIWCALRQGYLRVA